MHGGNAGAPVKHGRYSLKKERVQDKLQQYRDDPDRGELWEELALQRALLQDFLDSAGNLDEEQAKTAFQFTESISRTLDRINKIMSRTALTQAEVQYLQARFADILTKYVPKDKRHSALRELRGAIDGS